MKMSVLIMSLFIWMENINDNRFFVQNFMSSFHIHDAELLINQAISYINFLTSPNSVLDCNTINTTYMINNTNPLYFTMPINIDSLYLFKYTTISGMKGILRTICSRIFSDILYKIQYGNYAGFTINRTFTISGFPDPVFGHVEFYCWPLPHPMHQNFVNEEDRSLYVTFSRGFQVSKDDVTWVFLSNFGDCVQYVDMRRNKNDNKKQSLFARVIMKSVTIIDIILCGKNTAKFKIKGKHVWAKKFKKPKV
ncbi:hypothetical protein RND81_03G159100 [Saponaria officinalis]|uniref:Uncharacterized protein n=1 Tax=Saponaria officinalis TaxID=3572 RepID=A0AAW1M0L5_SAPOF